MLPVVSSTCTRRHSPVAVGLVFRDHRHIGVHKHGHSVALISAYAPTLVAPDDEKECALDLQSWNDHGIRLDTKIAVYKAAVLTSLV